MSACREPLTPSVVYFQKIGEIDNNRLYIVGVIADITDMRDAFSDSQQPAK
jgi:hypothetical protein